MYSSSACTRCLGVNSRGRATTIFLAGLAVRPVSCSSTALNSTAGSANSAGAPSGSRVPTRSTRSLRP